MSIQVIRAFLQFRQLLTSHADLARKLDALENKYDAQFKVVFDAMALSYGNEQAGTEVWPSMQQALALGDRPDRAGVVDRQAREADARAGTARAASARCSSCLRCSNENGAA